MINATLRNALRSWNSRRLQDLRKRIETKLLAEIAAGTAQARAKAFIREVDVMTAASEELHARPLTVPYVEVDQETVLGDHGTLMRSQRSYRVF